MKRITTESGTQYLLDEGAKRFKRLPVYPSPYVGEAMSNVWREYEWAHRWTVIQEGTPSVGMAWHDPEPGYSMHLQYGKAFRQYILTTKVVSIEEVDNLEV